MPKSIAYFKQKATIDKGFHKKAAYQIQLYNNSKVDSLVENFEDPGSPGKPSQAMLWAELSILNKPEVYKNYNRIIQSKYTSNSNFYKLLIRNKAQQDLNNIVEAEIERINRNLDYVEQVMRNYNISTKEYTKLVKDKPYVNRQKILTTLARRSNELLVSEGLNIPSNVFSYRDLETTATSLLRQSQMTAGYEEANSINEEAVNNGKSPVYTHKKWVWTGAGATTRHESNNMQTVPVDEPFIVVNDKTLEIDEMMYPCDPAGSPGNSYICYCEVDYTNEEGSVSSFWE